MVRNTAFVLIVGIALMFPIVLAGQQAAEEITREKVLSNSQEWQNKYDSYQPNAEMLNDMKGMVANLKIDIYLGLWCPDSRNNVPPFIKILDQLGTEIPVRYFGVPRKASKDVKYYVESMNVEKVPTFIIYREGKEIGRIVEKPKTGILEDFMDILLK